MPTLVPVLVGAALMAACGGAGRRVDAIAGDTGAALNACGVMVPDAAVFSCEAEPPGSVGCLASELDPSLASDLNTYPEGCSVALPIPSTFCGPVGCACMQNPSDHDAGLQFVCPL